MVRRVIEILDDPEALPWVRLTLARALLQAGKLAEAEAEARALLAEPESAELRSTPTGSFHAHTTLVDALQRRGAFAEAERVAVEELERVGETFGEDHDRFGILGRLHALALAGLGRKEEALARLDRLLETQTGLVREDIERTRAAISGASDP